MGVEAGKDQCQINQGREHLKEGVSPSAKHSREVKQDKGQKVSGFGSQEVTGITARTVFSGRSGTETKVQWVGS